MPTENRSAMISVPRDEVERLVKLLAYQAHPYPSPHAEYWQGILDAPAQQQGEPVVSQCPLCCQTHEQVPVGRAGGQQANGCDVDFTTWRCEGCGGSWTGDPADPGEVERLRAACEKESAGVQDLNDENQKLRAQLAKRDSLLREVLEAFKLEADGSCINPGRDFIRPWAAKLAALSASAEPEVKP